jgi:hypothetical protein
VYLHTAHRMHSGFAQVKKRMTRSTRLTLPAFFVLSGMKESTDLTQLCSLLHRKQCIRMYSPRRLLRTSRFYCRPGEGLGSLLAL